MRSKFLPLLSPLLLVACSANGDNGMATASNGSDNQVASSPANPINSSGEVATPDPEAPKATSEKSILAWSEPAAGSTVSGPVNELVFHISLPARLNEVTVTGPEGAMPMMVTAVGEVEHYSLPLSGLDTDSYTVAWHASSSDVDYRGNFGFQVKILGGPRAHAA